MEYCEPLMTRFTAADRVATWMSPPITPVKKRVETVAEVDCDGLVLVAGGAGDGRGRRIEPRQVGGEAGAGRQGDRGARRTARREAAATRVADLDDVGGRDGGSIAGVLHLAAGDHAVGAVEENGEQQEHDGEGHGHDHDDLAARIGVAVSVAHQWFTNMVELLVRSKLENPRIDPAAIVTVECTVTVTGVPRLLVAPMMLVSPVHPAP